jgi:hypothetical protein
VRYCAAHFGIRGGVQSFEKLEEFVGQSAAADAENARAFSDQHIAGADCLLDTSWAPVFSEWHGEVGIKSERIMHYHMLL